MKKTLLALVVAATAAGSANAYNFHIDQTGTDVNFYGSLRLKWEHINSKTTYANGDSNREIAHGDIDDNGSRFGFGIKQNLGNDFYALGKIEWRFRDTDARNLASNRHNNFGHIYTRQLFGGFGHKTFGELTYGNMTTFTDEIKQTDLANTYSLSDGLLVGNARRAVQYVNRGLVPNLKFGAFYGATSKRGATGLDLSVNRNHVWGAGAVYKFEIDSLQDVTTGLGFTRQTFANGVQETAYAFDNAYRFDNTTLGLDLEHKKISNVKGIEGLERSKYEARAVVHQKLSDAWNVYAMYAYRTNKLKNATYATATEKKSDVMLGTEYYVYQNQSLKVKPFVEGQVLRTRNLNNVAGDTQRDYKMVVGLRAYW